MSESVDILIKAEDQATQPLKQAAKAVDGLDANLKKIKESGQQAKKSTDFFKVFASSLGGSELGSYVGQLGEMAEKTAQFGEVQKLGGAGALAFKAGLVAAVGVLAYQFGSAIGNVIFQTAELERQMKSATEEAERLANATSKIQAKGLQNKQEEIELIRDPEEKKKANLDLLKSMEKELEGVNRRVNEGKKEVEEWDAAWLKTGNRAAFAEQAKAKLTEDKKTLDVMREQVQTQRELTGARTAENEELKKQNALKDKSDEYLKSLRAEIELLGKSKEEQAAILSLRNALGAQAVDEANLLLIEKERLTALDDENKRVAQLIKSSAEYVQQLRSEVEMLKASDDEKAALEAGQKTTGGDTALATQLIEERDLWKSIREQEKKAQAERESESKRLADLKQNELDKLEEERILLTQGKEAAKAFALEKQGLSAADAKDIARKTVQNQQIKIAPTVNQAFESRLLTRAPSDDAAKFTAQNTANALAELKAINQRQERIEKEANRTKGRITTLTRVA